jgi:hypothetical protein
VLDFKKGDFMKVFEKLVNKIILLEKRVLNLKEIMIDYNCGCMRVAPDDEEIDAYDKK